MTIIITPTDRIYIYIYIYFIFLPFANTEIGTDDVPASLSPRVPRTTNRRGGARRSLNEIPVRTCPATYQSHAIHYIVRDACSLIIIILLLFPRAHSVRRRFSSFSLCRPRSNENAVPPFRSYRVSSLSFPEKRTRFVSI